MVGRGWGGGARANLPMRARGTMRAKSTRLWCKMEREQLGHKCPRALCSLWVWVTDNKSGVPVCGVFG